VQVLSDNIESHYLWAQLQVETGFAGQTTNKLQMQQKALAKSYSPTDMEMLGIACIKENKGVCDNATLNFMLMVASINTALITKQFSIQFLIDSFTNPTVK
jgi:hypothetical protein